MTLLPWYPEIRGGKKYRHLINVIKSKIVSKVYEICMLNLLTLYT